MSLFDHLICIRKFECRIQDTPMNGNDGRKNIGSSVVNKDNDLSHEKITCKYLYLYLSDVSHLL